MRRSLSASAATGRGRDDWRIGIDAEIAATKAHLESTRVAREHLILRSQTLSAACSPNSFSPASLSVGPRRWRGGFGGDPAAYPGSQFTTRSPTGAEASSTRSRSMGALSAMLERKSATENILSQFGSRSHRSARREQDCLVCSLSGTVRGKGLSSNHGSNPHAGSRDQSRPSSTVQRRRSGRETESELESEDLVQIIDASTTSSDSSESGIKSSARVVKRAKAKGSHSQPNDFDAQPRASRSRSRSKSRERRRKDMISLGERLSRQEDSIKALLGTVEGLQAELRKKDEAFEELQASYKSLAEESAEIRTIALAAEASGAQSRARGLSVSSSRSGGGSGVDLVGPRLDRLRQEVATERRRVDALHAWAEAEKGFREQRDQSMAKLGGVVSGLGAQVSALDSTAMDTATSVAQSMEALSQSMSARIERAMEPQKELEETVAALQSTVSTRGLDQESRLGVLEARQAELMVKVEELSKGTGVVTDALMSRVGELERRDAGHRESLSSGGGRRRSSSRPSGRGVKSGQQALTDLGVLEMIHEQSEMQHAEMEGETEKLLRTGSLSADVNQLSAGIWAVFKELGSVRRMHDAQIKGLSEAVSVVSIIGPDGSKEGSATTRRKSSASAISGSGGVVDRAVLERMAALERELRLLDVRLESVARQVEDVGVWRRDLTGAGVPEEVKRLRKGVDGLSGSVASIESSVSPLPGEVGTLRTQVNTLHGVLMEVVKEIAALANQGV